MRTVIPALALLAAACGIPGPETSEGEIARLERATVSAPGGAAISYLRSGPTDGPRVVYVHGTPGDAIAWADYLNGASDGREHIAIDRPGFGRSAPAGAVVSLKAQAAALEPFLVRRQGKWPVLVGHSLGGPVIAQAALDYPGRVGALVIVSGSFDPGLEKVHFTQPMGEMWPIRAVLPRILRNSNLELLALKPELEALAARLQQVRVPIVIVHGTRDSLVPFDNVLFMERKFSGARALEIVSLKGRNHFLPWNSRSEIDAAVARAFALMEPGGL